MPLSSPPISPQVSSPASSPAALGEHCRLRALAALALASTSGCSGPEPSCGPRQARVERVIDGDTVELAGGRKIRYLLADAPESTSGAPECFGDRAAQLNADLVLGETVELAYDAAVCEDAFGRTLAYVTIDGEDVGRRMVERGYACALHIPPGGDDRAEEFAALEAAARAARRGLWGACDPAPCGGARRDRGGYSGRDGAHHDPRRL